MAAISPLELLLGPTLQTLGGGSIATSAVAAQNTVVALYFSAHW
jgi:hypothetical protein